MESEYDRGDRAQLFIAEGDTCFRQKLFDKAIEAYTSSLELVVDRNVLLNRSKCYVAVGKTDQAILDAYHAIDEAGADFYVGHFYKGEAFFAAGMFEEAIACYYRAYQKRPDVKHFKLGVQKAEEAILKALGSSIPYDTSVYPEELEALTSMDDMRQLIFSPPIGKMEANRCLCGCYNCYFCNCRDIYFKTAANQRCMCRCPACIYHLAQKHGVLSDPITGNPITCSELLLDDQPSINTTATPGTAHEKQKATPVESQHRTPVKRHKLVYKAPMQEDLELLQDLKNDEVLAKVCGSIQPDVARGISFITNRNEFWRYYGGNKGLNKKSYSSYQKLRLDKSTRQSRVATWAQPTTSTIQELQKYPLELNKVKQLMESEMFDAAIRRLEELEVELGVQRTEIALRLLNDIYVLLGCCHFEESRYKDSYHQFQRSIALSLELKDNVSIIRAYRCLIRAHTELGQYESVVDCAKKCLAQIVDCKQSWKYLTMLVKFSLCFASNELGERVLAVEQLYDLLETLQGSYKPLYSTACQVTCDSDAYFSNAFVIFSEKEPTPEQLLEDSLCMAGMLNFNQRGEEYLLSLVKYSEKCNDQEAKRAALQNLAYFYEGAGEVEKMYKVLAQVTAQ